MYNPPHVHPRYSDLMPEAVLYNSVGPIDEVIDSWGDLAKEVKAKRDEDDARYVTVYDYTDLEERAVWCVATSDPVAAPPDAKDVIQLIESQPHEMSFMPWVWRIAAPPLARHAPRGGGRARPARRRKKAAPYRPKPECRPVAAARAGSGHRQPFRTDQGRALEEYRGVDPARRRDPRPDRLCYAEPGDADRPGHTQAVQGAGRTGRR